MSAEPQYRTAAMLASDKLVYSDNLTKPELLICKVRICFRRNPCIFSDNAKHFAELHQRWGYGTVHTGPKNYEAELHTYDGANPYYYLVPYTDPLFRNLTKIDEENALSVREADGWFLMERAAVPDRNLNHPDDIPVFKVSFLCVGCIFLTKNDRAPAGFSTCSLRKIPT